MSVNSGLKATKIIGQRKVFYRQRVPEFCCLYLNAIMRCFLWNFYVNEIFYTIQYFLKSFIGFKVCFEVVFFPKTIRSDFLSSVVF